MRNLPLLILVSILFCAQSPDREVPLARQMLEDAILRNDVSGIELARGRLLRLASEVDDRTVIRDAHYLVALSALFESYSGFCDTGTGARLIASGIRHADRTIELDPQFADAWVLSAMLRGNAPRFGHAAPEDPPGAPNRFARAMELDSKSSAVMFFSGMVRSFDPAGPARPEGVQLLDDLVARLDAERDAGGRHFGLWDAQAHAWQIMVRMSADDPRPEVLRPMAARLMNHRPDFALGRQLEAAVAERRFVTSPALDWMPLLVDGSGDGSNPALPDLITVENAAAEDRVWYRVTFREPLPRSFGVNLVINRNGDPSTGMRWWGSGSDFRFDRLVTAWISRDGDRYFGRVGVTDDDGARGANLVKFPAEILLAMDHDDRSVIIGVPREAIGLTDSSRIVVAGGSHLAWNDDAATASSSE